MAAIERATINPVRCIESSFAGRSSRAARKWEGGRRCAPAAAMPGTPTLDFWFEFASTYSYPAALRIGDLARDRGVSLRWRPCLLGPVCKAQGWDNSPFNIYPAKGRYMWRDLERVCEALGIRFVRPAVFPQNTILASRVALVALAEGWGEDFCRAVYAAEFGEGRDVGVPAAVAAVLSGLKKDAAAVIERAQTDPIKLTLRRNTE